MPIKAIFALTVLLFTTSAQANTCLEKAATEARSKVPGSSVLSKQELGLANSDQVVYSIELKSSAQIAIVLVSAQKNGCRDMDTVYVLGRGRTNDDYDFKTGKSVKEDLCIHQAAELIQNEQRHFRVERKSPLGLINPNLQHRAMVASAVTASSPHESRTFILVHYANEHRCGDSAIPVENIFFL